MEIGKNLHGEYKWSDNINELFNQLYYQSTYKGEHNDEFILQFYKLVYHKEVRTNVSNLKKIGNLILYIRDKHNGKGERLITYKMLNIVAYLYPEVSQRLIETIIYKKYGGWNDVIYMWGQLSWEQPMIDFFIELVNNQLHKDAMEIISGSRENVSNVAKWIPREKKAYQSLFFLLAENYYCQFLLHDNEKARRKCYTHYRQLIVKCNKFLKTLEINLCGNRENIEYYKCSIASLLRNVKTLKKEPKYRKFMKNRNVVIPISLELLIKKALSISTSSATIFEENQINKEWKYILNQIDKLPYWIPIVDLSEGVQNKYLAIGMALIISQKSTFSNRILIYSSQAEWIKVEQEESLVSMIKKFNHVQSMYGMNNNLNYALNTLIKSLSDCKFTKEQVEQLNIVLFSNMIIDGVDCLSGLMSLSMHIKSSFHLFLKSYPSLILWNTNNSSSFPAFSVEKKIRMIQGWNPLQLNKINQCQNTTDFINKCIENY